VSETKNPPAEAQPTVEPVKKSKDAHAAEAVQKKFSGAVEEIREQNGEITLYIKREQIVEVCKYLRDEPSLQFNLLSDLTGLDRGVDEEPRFEVVYQIRSLPHRLRLRLKVRVEDEDCHAPTVSEVWKTANWHERETFDLFGIHFDGHPDLRKILTPDDLEGHPLRKDFPLRGY
jgi:NADH-quinone oxidoreductase subunit C